MTDAKLQLYHRMPFLFRNVISTVRGYQLRSWRYGPETARLVDEALERDHWSVGQWKSYHENRLAYVLNRAATQVPFYREQWAMRRRQGDQSSWESLENWPILDKGALRENPTAFVADDCNIRQMFHEHTSGTTGKSLDLWWSRSTVRAWYALFEARWRKWYGVSRHQRWAILGGQLITPVRQEKPPFWVWNHAMHQLYMSSYHLSPSNISYYLDALQRYKIRYLLGYTSALYALAQNIISSNKTMAQPRVVITNAEPVYDYQRQAIEQAFRCPVRETYGMSEIVSAGSECEAGHLHLWPEVGWIEVLENADSPAPIDHVGDIVATGLLNTDMPLIRYRVGDRGALSSQTRCECGRSLPQLRSIEGRTDDILYTRDGRQIGRLDPVFKARLPVLEAQIIQERLDRIRVLYVPAPDYTNEAGQSLIERIQERFGDVNVILESVPEVPRTNNGKFRAVICQLPAEERMRLEKLQ